MRKPTSSIIDALGTDRIAALLTETVENPEAYDFDIQRGIEDAVVAFLARNPIALSVIAHDEALLAAEPEAVQKIFRVACKCGQTAGERNRIQCLARKAGLGSLTENTVSNRPPVLTKSQRAGLERLTALARLHFRHATQNGIRLRTTSLITGPSGIGKSSLARELGRSLGLPVLKISYGEWIVSGSRSESTLQRLRAALDEHDRCILVIDELDKIQATADSWSRALLTEVYGVLDGHLAFVESDQGAWTPAHAEKLRRNVFIVGAGTWQELWQERTRVTMGFGTAQLTEGIPDRIRRANLIPEELLNRFNAEWIVLEPLTADDFRILASQLSLASCDFDPVAAEKSGLGFRAIEAAVTAQALRDMSLASS